MGGVRGGFFIHGGHAAARACLLHAQRGWLGCDGGVGFQRSFRRRLMPAKPAMPALAPADACAARLHGFGGLTWL